MSIVARAAVLAAAVAVTATAPAEAQVSTMRVTIAKGPHAGTYDLKNGQCDALDGQLISMFTPALAGGGATGRNGLESLEVYTEPAKRGPDGFSAIADFRLKSGRRATYQIYAIPPQPQAPGSDKPPSGRGSVAIQQETSGTTASFRGETKDGVGMEGSVTCVKR